MTYGVSFVIPCRNSASRLPATLKHLARQKVNAAVPWEVIVVDNASTDDTVDVAVTSWPQDPPAPLRVLHEPQLGAGHARSRGLTAARYEFVSCLDDDNWVCPDWVTLVAETMTEHPRVGACGSLGEAVCEGPVPGWFDEFKWVYAIGPWGEAPGDVTEKHAYGWSAGLTIRKTAWDQLQKDGFRAALTGRTGNSMIAGEDSELCYALRLSGWRWWYEPRLSFQHYLPAARLKWRYLRRLHRGLGGASVVIEKYVEALDGTLSVQRGRWIRNAWLRQSYYDTRKLVGFRSRLAKALFGPCEGDAEVLAIESQYGRLYALLRSRRRYEEITSRIARFTLAQDPILR